MKLSQETFKKLQAYVKEATGIAVSDGKTYLIESRFGEIVKEEGLDSFEALHAQLERGPSSRLKDAITNAITTNETLWFRDDGPWEILRKDLLPKFSARLQAGDCHRIRIWSAASSTGQEPYSLAMTIREYIEDEAPPSVKPESFEIVATDLSPAAIATAKAGRYEQLAASRGIEPEVISRFFEQEDGSITVLPKVRSMVRFERFDLQQSYAGLGKFDLILCRNVLIYFTNELKLEIFGKMARSLNPEGALILGGSESAQGAAKLFRMARCGRHLYYTPRPEETS